MQNISFAFINQLHDNSIFFQISKKWHLICCARENINLYAIGNYACTLAWVRKDTDGLYSASLYWNTLDWCLSASDTDSLGVWWPFSLYMCSMGNMFWLGSVDWCNEKFCSALLLVIQRVGEYFAIMSEPQNKNTGWWMLMYLVISEIECVQ